MIVKSELHVKESASLKRVVAAEIDGTITSPLTVEELLRKYELPKSIEPVDIKTGPNPNQES